MYFFLDIAEFAKRGPMSDDEYLRRYGKTRAEAAAQRKAKPKSTPRTSSTPANKSKVKPTPSIVDSNVKPKATNLPDGKPGFLKRNLSRVKQAPLKYKVAAGATALGVSALAVKRYRSNKEDGDKTKLDKDLKRLRTGTEAVRNVGSGVRAVTGISDTMRSWSRLNAQLRGQI